MKVDNIKLLEIKKYQTDFPNTKIQSSADAYNFIKQFYADDIDIFESCFILMLSANNKTISYAKISQGGITGSVVDIRIVAKYAVESLCTSIILAHNHPSGNTDPSNIDRKLTRDIKLAMDIFHIKLMDHIILTSESYYSFMDSGEI